MLRVITTDYTRKQLDYKIKLLLKANSIKITTSKQVTVWVWDDKVLKQMIQMNERNSTNTHREKGRIIIICYP